MAFTIGVSSGARIGPGMNVIGFGISGPVPIDDWLLIQVIDPATSAVMVYGSVTFAGSTVAEATIGIDAYRGFDQEIFYGLVDGATVDVKANHNHASGTTVDTLTVTGCHWDATSGLSNLLSRSLSGPLTGSVLAAILAAVQPTYHNA